jgi:hypothetical protein
MEADGLSFDPYENFISSPGSTDSRMRGEMVSSLIHSGILKLKQEKK